MAIEM